jgi:copper chaperone CopZ
MKLFPTALSFFLVSGFAFSETRKETCFSLKGMTCESCSKGITRVLLQQEGVKSAETSFPKKTTHITYDSEKTSPQKLQVVLKSVHYEATEKSCM